MKTIPSGPYVIIYIENPRNDSLAVRHWTPALGTLTAVMEPNVFKLLFPGPTILVAEGFDPKTGMAERILFWRPVPLGCPEPNAIHLANGRDCLEPGAPAEPVYVFIPRIQQIPLVGGESIRPYPGTDWCDIVRTA